MITNKLAIFIFAMFFAVASLYAATGARACECKPIQTTCTLQELNDNTCMFGHTEDDCMWYEVRTSLTPSQHDGVSTFTYSVSQVSSGSTKVIQNVYLLVPVCKGDNNFDGVVDNAISTAQPGWDMIAPGTGIDFFGEGDYQYSVFHYVFNQLGPLSLTTTTAVAGVTSMALQVHDNNTNSDSHVVFGPILGPACYVIPRIGAVATTSEQLGSNVTILISTGSPDGFKVSDGAGNPITSHNLNENKIAVCLDATFDGDTFVSCNDSHGWKAMVSAPDGTYQFGGDPCGMKLISGRYAYTCW